VTVYIAAPYEERKQANRVRVRLAAQSIACSSRWLTDDGSATLSHEWARADLDDVRAADALLALNPPAYHQRGSGGRHVELGYALALDKPILVVGERSNIFHYHHGVTLCVDVDEAIFRLGQLAQWWAPR
jgi:nucleoside 2-deoxyribosyltransferase